MYARIECWWVNGKWRERKTQLQQHPECSYENVSEKLLVLELVLIHSSVKEETKEIKIQLSFCLHSHKIDYVKSRSHDYYPYCQTKNPIRKNIWNTLYKKYNSNTWTHITWLFNSKFYLWMKWQQYHLHESQSTETKKIINVLKKNNIYQIHICIAHT